MGIFQAQHDKCHSSEEVVCAFTPATRAESLGRESAVRRRHPLSIQRRYITTLAMISHDFSQEGSPVEGVRWIKLDTGIFDSEKIRLIESMPDGDTLVVIWIKLLALAGKQGATGELMVAPHVPYTDEMLAISLNRSLTTVRLALDTFKRFGMIGERDGVIFLANWSEYQSTGGDTAKRQERNRRYYLKKQEEKALLESTESVQASETSNEKDLRRLSKTSYKQNSDALEIEIRDKSKEIKEHCRDGSRQNAFCDVVVGYLNAKTGKKFRSDNKKTRSLVSARASEGYQLEDFKAVIDGKCREWLSDSQMAKYLQPTTLFAVSHFDEYLANAKVRGSPKVAEERFSKFG